MRNSVRFQKVKPSSLRRVGARNARRRGSVLIETAAAVLVLLVPLLLGVIQFGMYYGATNVLSQVSREGGRYAAVYGLTQNDNFIKDYMIQVASQGNVIINRADIDIATPTGSPRQKYSMLNVTVRYNLGAPINAGGKRLIPLPALFNPGTVTRTYTVMAQ